MNRVSMRTLQLLLAAGAFSLSSGGWAEVEEIFVTATKREVSLQDVSIAVTALTEEALEDRNIRDFDTYLRSVPNAMFSNQGNNGNEVKIRGVGNGTSRLSPTVAVYLGEVPVVHNGRSLNSSYDFYITDMAQIEVLRGPQGQLYGSNSLGGAIRNIPKKPDLSGFAVSGSLSGSSIHGGSESYSSDLTLNVPLTDTTGLRLTGYGARQGGWYDNIFAGGVRIGDGSRATDLYMVTPPAPFSPPELDGLPVKFLPILISKVQIRNPADYDRVINYVAPSNAEEDVNTSDRIGARGVFTWEASDDITVDFMLAWEDKEIEGTSWTTDVPAIPGPYPYRGRGPQTYAIPRPETIDPGSTVRPFWNPTLYPTSAKKYEQENNIDAGNSDEILLANLVLNWDLGFANLTSSTGYWDRDEVLETSLPLGFIATGVSGTWPTKNQRKDNPQATIQELRLTSSDEGPLTWLAGAFYQEIDQDFTLQIIDPTGFMLLNLWPPRPPYVAGPPVLGPPWPADTELGTTTGSFTDEQFAVFGELAFDFTESINLAVSARWYDIDQKADITYSGMVFNQNLIPVPTNRKNSDSDVLPKVTLSWSSSEEELRVYATAAEGWRSGVVNEAVPTNICQTALDTLNFPNGVPDTDPDTVWNYELGAKMTSEDRRITLNGAIYKIDWKDLQSQVFLQTLDPSGQCVYDRLVNVGDASIWGVEAEATVRILDDLRLDAAFGYTDGEYDDAYWPLEIDAGETIEGTPEWTGYIGLQYDFQLWTRDGFVRADWTYTGDIAAKPTDFTDQPLAYSIGDFHQVNLRAGLGVTEQVRLEFFANNIFDEFAVTRAIDLDGAAAPTYFTLSPRSVGATLRFSF